MVIVGCIDAEFTVAVDVVMMGCDILRICSQIDPHSISYNSIIHYRAEAGGREVNGIVGIA